MRFRVIARLRHLAIRYQCKHQKITLPYIKYLLKTNNEQLSMSRIIYKNDIVDFIFDSYTVHTIDIISKSSSNMPLK